MILGKIISLLTGMFLTPLRTVYAADNTVELYKGVDGTYMVIMSVFEQMTDPSTADTIRLIGDF